MTFCLNGASYSFHNLRLTSPQNVWSMSAKPLCLGLNFSWCGQNAARIQFCGTATL